MDSVVFHCWIDIKSNTKSKNVQLKKGKAKTGGGKETNLFDLDPLEERISGMIGEVSIFGQSQTAEATVNFEGYYYNCCAIDSENIIDQPVEDITSIAEDNNNGYNAIHIYDNHNTVDTNNEHRLVGLVQKNYPYLFVTPKDQNLLIKKNRESIPSICQRDQCQKNRQADPWGLCPPHPPPITIHIITQKSNSAC